MRASSFGNRLGRERPHAPQPLLFPIRGARKAGRREVGLICEEGREAGAVGNLLPKGRMIQNRCAASTSLTSTRNAVMESDLQSLVVSSCEESLTAGIEPATVDV